MDGRDFYNLICCFFPDDKVVALYVNPLLNAREMFPEVQYVNPDGIIIPPFQADAEFVIMAGPLSGPFYDLPVEGVTLTSIPSHSDTTISSVSTIVKINNNLMSSKPILITRTPQEVYSILKDCSDDNWYIEDNSILLVHSESPDGLVQNSSNSKDSRV